jgi:hypothetical protein
MHNSKKTEFMMDPDFPPWADCLDGESASPAKAIDRPGQTVPEQIASK